MQLSTERIQAFKDILEKQEGHEVTWEEASESAHNLMGFAQLAYDSWVEDCHRKEKLKDNPKGFQLDKAYSCSICRESTGTVGNWYDKWGIKCMICQRAINRKEIPGSLAKFRDSWYSDYDLQSNFNLKKSDVTQWIKKGIIKARTISSDGKGVHMRLFLIKDNKGFLPPKKLVESQLVYEMHEGDKRYHTEPWYKFGNPHEHLKGYKIMDYLQVVDERPNNQKP